MDERRKKVMDVLGLLKIRVLRGNNWEVKDTFSSDLYVVDVGGQACFLFFII